MTESWLTQSGAPQSGAPPSWVDGNELAGALAEVFAVDVTTAQGVCAGCGRMAPVAETRVFDRAPGLVARCVGCSAVLLRVVRGPDRIWLDLRGMACVQIAMPGTGGASPDGPGA